MSVSWVAPFTWASNLLGYTGGTHCKVSGLKILTSYTAHLEDMFAIAGLIPGSAAEAMRVTHGRPPCALVAFGIGGRVAVLKPVLAHGTRPSFSQLAKPCPILCMNVCCSPE